MTSLVAREVGMTSLVSGEMIVTSSIAGDQSYVIGGQRVGNDVIKCTPLKFRFLNVPLKFNMYTGSPPVTSPPLYILLSLHHFFLFLTLTLHTAMLQFNPFA